MEGTQTDQYHLVIVAKGPGHPDNSCMIDNEKCKGKKEIVRAMLCNRYEYYEMP
jgi:hypothetical protein